MPTRARRGCGAIPRYALTASARPPPSIRSSASAAAPVTSTVATIVESSPNSSAIAPATIGSPDASSTSAPRPVYVKTIPWTIAATTLSGMKMTPMPRKSGA